MEINHFETLGGVEMSSPKFIEMSRKDFYEACLSADALRIGDGPAHIPKNLTQERDTRESILDTVF